MVYHETGNCSIPRVLSLDLTRGLQLWGRLDVLSNSLKPLWRRLMVEIWTFNSWQPLWWTFLQSACQLHAPSKLAPSVALCCVIKLHISEWPFTVASLRHTCPIIMLSNQHLDLPHLWGGWIILAKEKCSLTLIYTDLWTIFEINRPFVYIEKVLVFAFIILFSIDSVVTEIDIS